ncbi:ABC transporter ATP-binding protein [Oscillospiraceae bacterium CM]|nr:ABC transporter ATP-binding protein [Oscillospiraceae bacterium CM]
MKQTKNHVFHLLTDFARGSKRYFAGAVAAAALSILFTFLMPQIVGFTVDAVLGTKAVMLPAVFSGWYDALGGRGFLRAHFLFCAAGVVLSALLAGLFNYISRMQAAKGTERFTKKLRDTLFTHVQYLPFSWHNANQTGDIIQRCTFDVDTAQRFVAQQLFEVVRTFILVTLALVIMFSMNASLALIALGFIPLVIGYSTIFFKRIASRFKEADEAEGELLIHIQENLTGVRVVRAFGREKYELDRFDEKNDFYVGKWLSLGKILGIFWGIGDIVSALELLLMVAVGAVIAVGGALTLGQFLVFISYTLTMSWPVRQLGRLLSEMSKAGVSFARIKEILDAPVERDDPSAKKPPLNGDIVFDRVSFSYGAQPVLQELSFTVKSGKTLGILGATGAGKSTLTYLLNRLYDLKDGEGRITIGGTDIREIDRRYLRRHVGLVLQEPFLFSKTIFDNIDIAAETRDSARVRKSAEIAAMDETIRSFEDGYNTLVGERGVTLSGGQKQRLTMARTLMQNAPIMVFDDAMSSLDMETDAKIREALHEKTAGTTVILISHRIATLMLADTILVLENGRIAEIGSHEELVAQNGIYRRVYGLQSGLTDEDEGWEAAEHAGK